MRIVFVGASEVTVLTARYLIDRGHEVVIIEEDRDRIDTLSDDLDCSFLNGDGSRPAILQETNPKQTDVLVSISSSDQDNLIASLVGRSMGFKRVITSIRAPEFAEICRELGLENTIIPSRTISRYLADMIQGVNVMELSTVIKESARFFSFTAGTNDDGVLISELDLPEKAMVICYYREGHFNLGRQDIRLRRKDEVVILTDTETVETLRDRWPPQQLQNSKKIR